MGNGFVFCSWLLCYGWYSQMLLQGVGKMKSIEDLLYVENVSMSAPSMSS